MGDDLIFAQKFTRTAADGLALLVEMEDPRAAQEAAIVTDMMTTVQRGAKRLRARYIYSGAQGVLSALHHETDSILQGRIESLGSLVTEYARGLDELLQNPEQATPKTRVEKWNTARETLNGLLPTASAQDADMLSRLMRAPVTLEAVNPEQDENLSQGTTFQDSEIVPFPRAITSLITEEAVIDVPEIETPVIQELSPLNQKETIAPRRQYTDLALEVPLESMMRDVIADALSVARSVGQTISLSYDMGNKTVSEAKSENLQERLCQALSQIIRQSLTEDRIGHIDINLAGEQIHIMAGTTAMRVAIDHKANLQPTTKPLITFETEQDLRSQLNAVTDTQSIQETVSLHETAS